MNTKKDEFFIRNSELSMEFSKYALEHPEMDELLAEDTVVVFLPEFGPKLKAFNVKMGKEIEAEGGKVLYIKLKELSPEMTSRLIGVEVALQEI